MILKKSYNLISFILLVIFAIAVSEKSFSQKKIAFYNVDLYHEKKKGEDLYRANGKKINKKIYDKYTKGWKNVEKCTPCWLQNYNENDVILTEGLFYKNFPIGKFKDYYLNGNLKREGSFKKYTGKWKYFSKKFAQIKIGKWKHYSISGNIIKEEIYENGNLLNEKRY